MKDWDDACMVALALPGVAMDPYYGVPVPKVAGKPILAPGREAGSFVLMTSAVEKQVLMATDPDTFWQTPHYEGYAAVLVRYGTPARDRIAAYIERSWWDRATPDLRAKRGDGKRP